MTPRPSSAPKPRARPGLPAQLRVDVGSRIRTDNRRPAVRVHVAEPSLRRRLVTGISKALASALQDAASTPVPPMVVVGSLGVARRLRDQLPGNLVALDVTRLSPARLRALLVAVEATGPAGIQLVWQSTAPLSGPLEAAVFEILEQRRGQPGKVPVLLARTARPLEAWCHVLAAARRAVLGSSQ